MLSTLQLIWQMILGVYDVETTCKFNIWSTSFGFSILVSCIGRKFPVALMADVTVTCFLLSAPFIRMFLAPFKLNVHVPGDT